MQFSISAFSYLCNLVFLHFPVCAILGGVSCICGGSVTEGQLPSTAARQQMSLDDDDDGT